MIYFRSVSIYFDTPCMARYEYLYILIIFLFHLRIFYPQHFGGITGFTRNQMKAVNGYSNVYWGWGSEDDDMYKRVRYHGYQITRPTGAIGFYDVVKRNHTERLVNNKR